MGLAGSALAQEMKLEWTGQLNVQKELETCAVCKVDDDSLLVRVENLDNKLAHHSCLLQVLEGHKTVDFDLNVQVTR